jgi:hypothetical protein
MMLRSLVDEVVRRRLWPIPLVALLIAIAAPVLFLKSAPADAPAATQAPPAAAPGELPGTAEKLVTTSDKAVTPRQTSKPKAQDPFAPPASAAKKDASSGSAAAAATAGPSAAVGVVIAKSSAKAKTTKSSQPTNAATPKVSKPTVTVPKTTPVVVPAANTVAYVDVRFAKRANSMVRYRIPRLQTFQAGRKVAAMFVGYSAKRNAAVFAVAPSTEVKGLECRKVKGVCRYVDIPAGSYARLVLRDIDGSLVSRRLDVVSIRHLAPAPASKASARKTTLEAATCLLENLLKLPAIAPSIRTDACA